MTTVDYVVKNAKLVIPRLGVVDGSLAIDEGKIVAVTSNPNLFSADRRIDAKGRYVFPGVIDPHVHYGHVYPKFNLDFKENMLTETLSAAIGGITTIDIMFRNFPTSKSYFKFYEENKEAGEERAWTDFIFSYAVTHPLHLKELLSYVEKCGVTSFKYFLGYKGSSDLGDIGRGDDGLLYLMMKRIARLDKTVLTMVHCENSEIIDVVTESLKKEGQNLSIWQSCRPNIAEEESVSRVILFASRLGVPLYIPHISSAEGIDVVKKSKAEKRKVYAETCPHYLTLTKDATWDEGVLAKCMPPIRDEVSRQRLWEGIFDGTIDTIGSDHAPIPLQYKKGDLWSTHAGFPGSATILPLMLSEGFHKRGLSLQKIAELTSYNSARIFGLYPQKGTLTIGSDADLTIVNLDKTVTLNQETLKSSAGYTPYEGWEVNGWPELTMLRGTIVVEDGEPVAKPGIGHYVPRKEAIT